MNRVFVYGTLLDPTIRKRVLGRVPELFSDRLDDFEKTTTMINGSSYPMAIPKKASVIEGAYIEVSDEELNKLDLYETNTYVRKELKLASGVKSLVYCSL